MKKNLLILTIAVLVLGTYGLVTVVGASKEPKPFKPVAVVSIAGYDKTLDNVAMLGRAFGKSDLAKDLITVMKLIAIQQGLAGPDKERPWGIAIRAEADSFAGCGFLPSSDLSSLAEIMKPFVGDAESIGGGIYKLRGNATPFYVTQKDGWAFFAYSPEELALLPPDPMSLLDGLNMEYDIALRLYAANTPSKCRERVVGWITNYVDPDAKQYRYEPDRIFALRKEIVSDTVKPVVAAIHDAESVTAGWKLDLDAKKTSLELCATAKDGSETAKRIAGVFDVKSEFKGFRLPDAALTANWAFQLPSLKSATPDALVNAFRVLAIERIDANEKSMAKALFARQLSADLADLVLANIHSGRADGGTALVLKPNAVTVSAGGFVADSAKLTESLKRIVAAAKLQDPRVAEWIKLDAGEIRSVRFHTASIPIPAEAKDRSRLVALMGDKLEIAIGIGPKSAYVALGREPLETLKRVIDLSAADAQKDVPAGELSLSLGATAKFVAASGKNERVRSLASIVVAALEPAGDRDHIRATVRSIPRGVQWRLEIEEGPLKLVGRIGEVLSKNEKPKDSK